MDEATLEAFALADERSAVLEQLVPGTEDYYFFLCLQRQHEGAFEEVEGLIEVWTARHGWTHRVEEVLDRQALLTYGDGARGEKALARLRERLAPRLTHERQVEGEEARYPSRLEPIVREDLLRATLGRSDTDLREFTDAALEWLLEQQLDRDRRRTLLSRLRRPDHAALVQHVLADLDDRHTGGFGTLALHRQLLDAQLENLAWQRPELAREQAFVEARIVRLHPGPDVNWEDEPAPRAAYLERLGQLVEPLAPAFNSLKAHVLYHRLAHHRAQGGCDRERLLAYLALPLASRYAEPRHVQRQEHRGNLADPRADYSALTLLPAVRDDEPLIRDLLARFLLESDDLRPFDTYVRRDVLRGIQAEAKLLAGRGDVERWYSLLDDPARYQQLKDRVELELAPENPTVYALDEPVRLAVDVKNVRTLVVKVVEVNALNYALATGKEVDAAIDLDGLIAGEEALHSFDEPPLRRVRRTFELPSLTRPGVFVVELIGNGRSSRALIRKGTLRALERVGAAGHVLRVLDESDRPVPDASVWLGGREHRADAEGAIAIPFSATPGRRPILLQRGPLVVHDTLDQQAERFRLEAAIHVEREALLPGRQADVLVRAALSVNGAPASLSLLEETALTVACTDLDGVCSAQEVSGFELAADREAVHAFRVPERLARLELTVRAKVRLVSSGARVELSDSRAYALNGIEATDRTEALHLAWSEAGYVLHLLGRSGEPRAGVTVQLELTHRDVTRPETRTLQTDAAGRIELGDLAGFTALGATTSRGDAGRWPLLRERRSLPAAVHAPEGEAIRIPALGARAAAEVSPGAYSLLSQRGGAFLADHLGQARHEDGFLVVEGLPAGDYELLLKEDDRCIPLRVSPGRRVEGWIAGGRRLLEASGGPALQLISVERGEHAVVARLVGASPRTRVHAVATRFLSPDPAGADLLLGPLRDPRHEEVAPPRSEYLSGRELGDEVRYVLERKYARKFPGNMLSRPGLLLNPWAMRTADTGQDRAAAGGAFGARAGAARKRMAAPRPKAQASREDGAGHASLSFLPRQATVLANLRPDATGAVSVPREALAGANTLWIVAVDGRETLATQVPLTEAPGEHEDLRLRLGLDPGGHFIERRQTTLMNAGDALVFEDITTSELEVYDTLARAHRLLATLSGDATLEEFGFVTRWPALSAAEQRRRYGEYACHELNLFLSRKDPAFFEAVVRPYLANKKDKTFLDRYLLGEDLRGTLRPWAYARLNAAEQVLLAGRLEDERPHTTAHLDGQDALAPAHPARDELLFRTALQGSALEADGLQDQLAGRRDEAAGLRLASLEMDAFAPLGEEGFEAMRSMPAPAPRSRAPSASRPPAPPGAPSAKMADEAEPMDEECDDLSAEELGGGPPEREERDARARGAVRPYYRQLDPTQELGENDYYQRAADEQGPELVPVNPFWCDLARHRGDGPFLSPHLPRTAGTFTEMMLALAVLDLPFEAPPHDIVADAGRMTLRASGPALVFHKQVKPAAAQAERAQVLVSQDLLRHDDRYEYEGGQRRDKLVRGELLRHTVYVCSVALTNPTSAERELDLLLQIPRGSVPVLGSLATRGLHVRLGPYATQSLEYAFYFPAAGTFAHYPVHVARGEELLAAAEPRSLKVVERPTTVDRSSWAYLSQEGSEEEVLARLETANLHALALEAIAWRMRERGFYERALALLTRRHGYCHPLWGYSLLHDDPTHLAEYLRHEEGFLMGCGFGLEGPLLRIDPVERGWHQHREYAPLVNARAHPLGGRSKILNARFARQYREQLRLLAYRPALRDADRLALASYLFLQDRIDEGLAFLAKVEEGAVETRLQHDYLRAYAAFYEEPERARALALRHAEHPVPRWRRLFEDVLAQLDEARGGAVRPEERQGTDGEAAREPGDREERHARLAASEPSLEFTVEDRVVRVSYQNLSACRVSYYLMDVELLFSRQPFVQGQSGQFAFVQPNRSDVVALPPDAREHAFELPAELHAANAIVELEAEGIREAQAHYAHALTVQVIERYGQLQVTRQSTGEPLPGTYVKVYARLPGGEARFFKDGYTDLRGRLDYASLSGEGLEAVERFALLVLHPEHGAVIREAAPPPR